MDACAMLNVSSWFMEQKLSVDVISFSFFFGGRCKIEALFCVNFKESRGKKIFFCVKQDSANNLVFFFKKRGNLNLGEKKPDACMHRAEKVKRTSFLLRSLSYYTAQKGKN